MMHKPLFYLISRVSPSPLPSLNASDLADDVSHAQLLGNSQVRLTKSMGPYAQPHLPDRVAANSDRQTMRRRTYMRTSFSFTNTIKCLLMLSRLKTGRRQYMLSAHANMLRTREMDIAPVSLPLDRSIPCWCQTVQKKVAVDILNTHTLRFLTGSSCRQHSISPC